MSGRRGGRTRRVVILAVGALAGPRAAAGQAYATDSAWLASKGFQQRAQDALLHGDRAAIRAWRERSVSEVLENVPRIELRTVAGSDRIFVLHPTEEWRAAGSGGGCILSIYLNGGRVHPADGRAVNVRAVDRAVRLRDVDGIEVHGPDTSPVGEGDLCGSVLLWSRRVRREVDEEFVGRLRGRATWAPEQTPARGIAVTLEPGGIRQATDSGGWFDFGALVPGRYVITAMAPEGATWSGQLIIKAYGISQVEIEVTRREEGSAW